MNCEVCNSSEAFNRHHLIPQELNRVSRRTIRVCKECHQGFHKYFSSEVLAEKYNTASKLKEVRWVWTSGIGSKGERRRLKHPFRLAFYGILGL